MIRNTTHNIEQNHEIFRHRNNRQTKDDIKLINFEKVTKHLRISSYFQFHMHILRVFFKFCLSLLLDLMGTQFLIYLRETSDCCQSVTVRVYTDSCTTSNILIAVKKNSLENFNFYSTSNSKC